MSDGWDQYELWRAKHIDCEHELKSAAEAKRELDACLDEYAAIKRALFLDGFCDFVIKQGFGAASPIKVNGRPESWQMRGRKLWGTKHFDEAMKRAIERRRGRKTSDPISPESSQP